MVLLATAAIFVPATGAQDAPANDLAENAEVVSSFPYTDIETGVIDATTSPSDPLIQPSPMCSPGFPRLGSNSIWYQVTAPTDGLLDIDTNGSANAGSSNALNTILAVFTGTYPSLTQIACDDDSGDGLASAIMDLSVDSGVTYLIYVARFSNNPTNANDSYTVHFDFSSTGPGTFGLVQPLNGAQYTVPTVPTQFTWSAAFAADSYTLAINNGTSDIITQSGLTSPTASLSGAEVAALVAGSYTWRVTAFNSDGSTLAENAPFAFEILAPPRSFALAAPADSAIFTLPSTPSTFSWSAASGAESYTFTIHDGTADVIVRTGETGTSVVLDAGEKSLLVPGNYTWSVVAVNAIGTTLASNAPYAFTVLPEPQPPGPFDLVTPASISQFVQPAVPATFAWSSAVDAASYTLTINDGATDFIMRTGLTNTSVTLSLGEQALLVPGSYTWNVLAVNPVGTTGASNAPFTFTVAPAPILPGAFNLIAPLGGSTYMLPDKPSAFTWSSSANAATYTFVIRSGATDIITQSGLTTPSAALGPGELALLSIGSYTWTVRAWNTDGSIEASNAEFAFSITPEQVERLLNGSFEISGFSTTQAAGWTGRFLSGKDIRVCDNLKLPATDGHCVYRFKYVLGADPLRKLSQVFDAPLWGDAGERLDFRFTVSGKAVTEGAKVVLNVKYVDGTKSKFKPAIPVGTYAAQQITGAIDILKRVVKVKVHIKPSVVNGSFWLDSMSMLWTQATPREVVRTDSTVLPPPAAPDGFRGNN